MGTPTEIYTSKNCLTELIDEMGDLPSLTFVTLRQAKNVEQELRECENCGYSPDLRLQNQIEQLANLVYDITLTSNKMAEHLTDLISACGWTLDYDEDSYIHRVNGPCWDDEDK